jgi:2,4-dienoyl-CoA reductase
MDDLKDADFASNAKFFEAKKTPMLPKDTFKGRVAFVTGGGTGLGKNMAQMLSNLGAKVFITSRREEVLKKAAQEITANTGNEVAYFPADVRNPEQIEKSLEACISSFKNLPTIVINNAAGNFISPTERLSPNAIKAIIDIVLLGTLNTTLIIGKRLIKEGKGFLILIY